jgi:hypothetical protein
MLFRKKSRRHRRIPRWTKFESQTPGLFQNVERLEDRLLLSVLVESGNFAQEISRLKDLAFGSGSNQYFAPTPTEQSDFNSLATTLLNSNVSSAETQAAALGYELSEFTDTGSENVYYELREQLVGGSQTKGWGTFVVNPSFLSDAGPSRILVKMRKME